mmetsp:Transcript_18208/g.41141  ORF Transcript_18208/g.41141 Transcript_18208/m.41141 type:complete len:339 (+) Transcript_18208:453-1469(+)
MHEDEGLVHDHVLAALNVSAQLLGPLSLRGDLHRRRRAQQEGALHPLCPRHALFRLLELNRLEAGEGVTPTVLVAGRLDQGDAQGRIEVGGGLDARRQRLLPPPDVGNLPTGQLWDNMAYKQPRGDGQPVIPEENVEAVKRDLCTKDLLHRDHACGELERLLVEVHEHGDPVVVLVLTEFALVVFNTRAEPVRRDPCAETLLGLLGLTGGQPRESVVVDIEHLRDLLRDVIGRPAEGTLPVRVQASHEKGPLPGLVLQLRQVDHQPPARPVLVVRDPPVRKLAPDVPGEVLAEGCDLSRARLAGRDVSADRHPHLPERELHNEVLLCQVCIVAAQLVP